MLFTADNNMKQHIKKVITNTKKPANPKVVIALALASYLVVFFPQWFNEIPFPVPEVIKATVEWVFKGVDLTLASWALFSHYDYKGSIYKRENNDGPSE